MRLDQRLTPAQAAAWWRQQARADQRRFSGRQTWESEYITGGQPMVIVEHDNRRTDCRGTRVTQWYRQAGFPE